MTESTPVALLNELKAMQDRLNELVAAVKHWGLMEMPPPVLKFKIETIIETTAQYYGVPVEIVRSPGKGNNERLRVRRAAMVAVYELLGLSYFDVCRAFNRKSPYSFWVAKHKINGQRQDLETIKKVALQRMDQQLYQFHKPAKAKTLDELEDEPDTDFQDSCKPTT